MVRRPWLRRTRLAGRGAAGVTVDGGRPSRRSARCAVTDATGAVAAAFEAVVFLVRRRVLDCLGAGAGSRWTLGDPMPGAW